MLVFIINIIILISPIPFIGLPPATAAVAARGPKGAWVTEGGSIRGSYCYYLYAYYPKSQQQERCLQSTVRCLQCAQHHSLLPEVAGSLVSVPEFLWPFTKLESGQVHHLGTKLTLGCDIYHLGEYRVIGVTKLVALCLARLSSKLY